MVEDPPQVPLADHPHNAAAAVDRLGALEGPRQIHVPLMQQRAHHLWHCRVLRKDLWLLSQGLFLVMIDGHPTDHKIAHECVMDFHYLAGT